MNTKSGTLDVCLSYNVHTMASYNVPALSWYSRLSDTYNLQNGLVFFVQAFKKQFSSQNDSNYAQVKALNFVKKDNETVRLFALKA